MASLNDVSNYVVDVPTLTASWILLFVLALILVSNWIWPILRMHIIASKCPGPPGRFLIGNALEFKGGHKQFFHVLNRLCSCYGRVYKLWTLHHFFIILSDPDNVKFVMAKLKTNNRPNLITSSLGFVIGNGLASLPDDEIYKNHKKLLMPLFYKAMLKNYHTIFDARLVKLSTNLSKIADGSTIDIFKYTSSYTIQTICSTVIGCDEATLNVELEELSQNITEMDDRYVDFVVKPWLWFPLVRRLVPSGRRSYALREYFRRFVERLLSANIKGNNDSQRTEEGNVKLNSGNDKEFFPPRKVTSILDLIAGVSREKGSTLTFEEIKEEIMTFVITGYQTMAVTLAFLFVLLGIHQEVQEEVSRELEEVFGSSLRPATSEDLSRLETLERVIKETLRLFPPVPFVPRTLSEDVKLPCGQVLPAGCNTVIYVYQILRDPKSYQDPDSFIPDRWRPENSRNLNPDAFIPFGAGSRTCIGFRYAMLQLKVASCHLLRRFKVTTGYTMKDLRNLNVAIGLTLDGTYHVQLHKRKEKN